MVSMKKVDVKYVVIIMVVAAVLYVLYLGSDGYSGYPNDIVGQAAGKSYCGNSIKEGTEKCDKTDLGGATCVTAYPTRYAGGSLSCTSSCTYEIFNCLWANSQSCSLNSKCQSNFCSMYGYGNGVYSTTSGICSTPFTSDGTWVEIVLNKAGTTTKVGRVACYVRSSPFVCQYSNDLLLAGTYDVFVGVNRDVIGGIVSATDWTVEKLIITGPSIIQSDKVCTTNNCQTTHTHPINSPITVWGRVKK